MYNINNIHIISGILKPLLLFNHRFRILFTLRMAKHENKQESMKTEHKQDKPKSALYEVYLVVILK